MSVYLPRCFTNIWDPLPPGPAYNVVGDRHVAQRNIVVLQLRSNRFHFSFAVANPWPMPKKFDVQAGQAPLDGAQRLDTRLQHDRLPKREGKIENLAFTPLLEPGDQDRDRARKRISNLVLPPGGRRGLTLVGEIDRAAGLVLIEQRADDNIVGGIALVVVLRP
jgi:hypothetical protein